MNSELRHLLENAVDELPDDFRAVFVLRAVEGMSISEAAQCLSIRPETVKTRFHRARHLLQKSLGAQIDTLMPSAFAFGGQHCDRIVEAVLSRLGSSLKTARRRAKASTKPRFFKWIARWVMSKGDASTKICPMSSSRRTKPVSPDL